MGDLGRPSCLAMYDCVMYTVIFLWYNYLIPHTQGGWDTMVYFLFWCTILRHFSIYKRVYDPIIEGPQFKAANMIQCLTFWPMELFSYYVQSSSVIISQTFGPHGNEGRVCNECTYLWAYLFKIKFVLVKHNVYGLLAIKFQMLFNKCNFLLK